jgi:hypothetical protein
MKQYQIDFLKNNIGFDPDELSIKRFVELGDLVYRQKLSEEFVYAALSFKSLEDWEKWGFGLFFIDNFIERVYDYLDAVDEGSEKELKLKTKKDYIGYSKPKEIIKYNRLNLNKLKEGTDYRLFYDDMLGWLVEENNI